MLKKKFFDNLSSKSIALINADDKHSSIMVQNTLSKVKKYGTTYNSDYKLKILTQTLQGTEIEIDNQKIWTLQPCNFNQFNLIATYAVLQELGFDKDKSLKALSSLKLPRGRMNILLKDQVYYVIDYAHTPDALHHILKNLNKLNTKKGSIITVFGCGGNRDKAKRPKMGRIASTNSRIVILTNDNPRNEEPQNIINDIKKGIKDVNCKIIEILNRKEAIKTASLLAKPNDIVLIPGKGHEQTQEIKNQKYSCDDLKILNNLFKFTIT